MYDNILDFIEGVEDMVFAVKYRLFFKNMQLFGGLEWWIQFPAVNPSFFKTYIALQDTVSFLKQ